MEKREKLRNIAIIAHVDHGKTTLVDKLFQDSDDVGSKEKVDRIMDSGAIERERGITILAKNTGLVYKNNEINIVDTPGHSDFGGEVERTLQMVEGFLLLVDAAEGVLPGTRFVLSKALELNLKPIVMINKVDRKDADVKNTSESVQDLFLDLAVHEDQLEFPILYGSGKLGWVTDNPEADFSSHQGDMKLLLDTILETIPKPENKNEGLQFLTTSLDHSEFLGPVAIGRVFSGSLKVGEQFICCKDEKISKPMKITKIYKLRGVDRLEVESASFGDIVAITGFSEQPSIGTTLCNVDNPLPYNYVSIDEPTLSMNFSVNDSPFSGKEGSLLTSRQIKERLEKELKTNVALRVEPTASPDSFRVSGRGQLHLGILIENMRREGFELQVSSPQVIYKQIDGVKSEPIELLMVDIQEEHQGIIMESIGRKKAEMTNMTHFGNGRVRIEFKIPSRGLLGFRSQFLTDTRGTGIATFQFSGYEPYKGDIPLRTKGAIVSMEQGSSTSYSFDTLQDRGTLFIKTGTKVYEGMIIGENSREGDMTVNPTKEKKLTNMRASGTDDAVRLEAPRVMDLERCMEWIQPDELIEITPESIRLRKKVLRASMRKK